MNTCYIVGAMKCRIDFTPDKSDFVIAADKGYENLKNAGIIPDVTIGDFDSLGYTPSDNNIIIHPPEKDDTDTLLAVRLGLEKDFMTFKLYGCTGGRIDHTLANIQTLCFICDHRARGTLIDDGVSLTVIKDSALTFPAGLHGIVSVFALCGPSEGVSIKGLKYELDNAVLTPVFPLGVSNEFYGQSAEIRVKNGYLGIIWFDKNYL